MLKLSAPSNLEFIFQQNTSRLPTTEAPTATKTKENITGNLLRDTADDTYSTESLDSSTSVFYENNSIGFIFGAIDIGFLIVLPFTLMFKSMTTLARTAGEGAWKARKLGTNDTTDTLSGLSFGGAVGVIWSDFTENADTGKFGRNC